MNSSRFFVSFEDLILSRVPFGFHRVDMYCESCGGDYHGRVFGLVYWGENYECTCSEWCPLIVYYDNVDFREVIYMTNKPKEIVDIDAGDANNELAAVEYLLLLLFSQPEARKIGSSVMNHVPIQRSTTCSRHRCSRS
ncbi:uncharacterized protein LOC123899723 [Trifolium pratense]|nr:uncharacterized protein LOC123899723 [Trifolium pratense]